ncbi:hypothetical protein GB937_009081 [Aspergillus fischeri]|nr:hypothetical protein GB937_009081 [Aspergillus fischeri]
MFFTLSQNLRLFNDDPCACRGIQLNLAASRERACATWVKEVVFASRFGTVLPLPTQWSNRNSHAAKKFACEGCVGRADHQQDYFKSEDLVG